MSLLVVKSLGLVTVQDLGRPGRMHQALPPGGALVRSMLVRANRTAGNSDDAAAIEVSGLLVVRAERDLRIGTDRTDEYVLRTGEEISIASESRRVTYLAVRGGVDAPVVLGGRGAHLSAGIGALLRAGDRIEIGDSPTARTSGGAPRLEGPVRIVVGPDDDAFVRDAIDTLVSQPWRIGASSDRVGTRLVGQALARRAEYVEHSRPLVVGAIEVPADGAPIVLGPEHPTTGGYPVLAVIASESLDAFHAIPLGGSVRFAV